MVILTSIAILIGIILLVCFGSKHYLPESLSNRLLPSWLDDKPIAHRGLYSDVFPENTLGAFENAITNGYAIELDILDAENNLPIVFHDETLLRLVGEEISIHDIDEDQLSNYRIKGSMYSIPTLEEALKVIDGKTPIIIDIKQSILKKGFLINVKACLQEYSGPYIIQSFNPIVLNWFYNEMPDALRAQSLEDFNGSIQTHFIITLKDNLFMCISKPNLISCKRNLLESGYYSDIYSRGVNIIGWLFNLEEYKSKCYEDICSNVIVGEMDEQ